MRIEELSAALQFVENVVAHFVSALARERARALGKDAVFVDWDDDREVFPFAEVKVLRAASGSDMYDAASLVVHDVLPRDDPVVDARLKPDLGETGLIVEPDELGALELRYGLVFGCEFAFIICLAHDEDFALVRLHRDVVELRINRERDVGGQRPRRRRPDEHLPLALDERELYEHGDMLALFI